MTGKELTEWLIMHEADVGEKEVFFLQDDNTLADVKPEMWTNEKAKDEYPEVRGMNLPDGGWCIVL